MATAEKMPAMLLVVEAMPAAGSEWRRRRVAAAMATTREGRRCGRRYGGAGDGRASGAGDAGEGGGCDDECSVRRHMAGRPQASRESSERDQRSDSFKRQQMPPEPGAGTDAGTMLSKCDVRQQMPPEPGAGTDMLLICWHYADCCPCAMMRASVGRPSSLGYLECVP